MAAGRWGPSLRLLLGGCAALAAASAPPAALSPQYHSARGADCPHLQFRPGGTPAHISGHEALVSGVLANTATPGAVTPGTDAAWPTQPTYGTGSMPPQTFAPLRIQVVKAYANDERYACFQSAADAAGTAGRSWAPSSRRGGVQQQAGMNLYADIVGQTPHIKFPDACAEADVLTPAKQQRLEALASAAAGFAASALRARHGSCRTADCLKVRPPTAAKCWGADISSALGAFDTADGPRPAAGYDADFVLVLSAQPTQWLYADRATGAWAVPCLLADTGRPVLGVLNVDPSRLLLSGDREADYQLRFVLQELFHALGFSSLLMDRWIAWTPSGSEYARRSGTVEAMEERGGTVDKLATPAAWKAAADYFGCEAATLGGVELEDHLKAAGRPSSHLEQRIYRDELMAATVSRSAGAGPVTLGVMADTGWYKVDPGRAQHTAWGKGLGCDFAVRQCTGWAAELSCSGLVSSYLQRGINFGPGSAVTVPSERQCAAAGRPAIQACDASYVAWSSWASVPSRFRYFPGRTAQVAGCSPFADYCTLWRDQPTQTGADCSVAVSASGWKDCTQPGVSCPLLSVPGTAAAAGATYGAKCYHGTLRTAESLATGGAGGFQPQCLPTQCFRDPGTNRWAARIFLGDPAQSLVCYRKGQVVGQAAGSPVAQAWGNRLWGDVQCPDPDEACGGAAAQGVPAARTALALGSATRGLLRLAAGSWFEADVLLTAAGQAVGSRTAVRLRVTVDGEEGTAVAPELAWTGDGGAGAGRALFRIRARVAGAAVLRFAVEGGDSVAPVEHRFQVVPDVATARLSISGVPEGEVPSGTALQLTAIIVDQWGNPLGQAPPAVPGSSAGEATLCTQVHDGFCLRLDPSPRSRGEAQAACEAGGGVLATVSDHGAMAAVAATASAPVWIGLSSTDGGDTWEWDDGTGYAEMQPPPWAADQPAPGADFAALSLCVVQTAERAWRTADCYAERMGSVCAAPLPDGLGQGATPTISVGLDQSTKGQVSDAALGGALSLPAPGGKALFTITVRSRGQTVVLQATTPGASAATAAVRVAAHGSPAALSITARPGRLVAGAPFTLTAAIVDSSGAPVTAGAPAPTGWVWQTGWHATREAAPQFDLASTPAASPALRVPAPGAAGWFSARVSATGLGYQGELLLRVHSGPPARLAVTEHPSNAVAGSAMGPVVVEARDASGAVSCGWSRPVRLSLTAVGTTGAGAVLSVSTPLLDSATQGTPPGVLRSAASVPGASTRPVLLPSSKDCSSKGPACHTNRGGAAADIRVSLNRGGTGSGGDDSSPGVDFGQQMLREQNPSWIYVRLSRAVGATFQLRLRPVQLGGCRARGISAVLWGPLDNWAACGAALGPPRAYGAIGWTPLGFQETIALGSGAAAQGQYLVVMVSQQTASAAHPVELEIEALEGGSAVTDALDCGVISRAKAVSPDPGLFPVCGAVRFTGLQIDTAGEYVISASTDDPMQPAVTGRIVVGANTLSITSPAEGSEHAAGASLSITATATTAAVYGLRIVDGDGAQADAVAPSGSPVTTNTWARTLPTRAGQYFIRAYAQPFYKVQAAEVSVWVVPGCAAALEVMTDVPSVATRVGAGFTYAVRLVDANGNQVNHPNAVASATTFGAPQLVLTLEEQVCDLPTVRIRREGDCYRTRFWKSGQPFAQGAKSLSEAWLTARPSVATFAVNVTRPSWRYRLRARMQPALVTAGACSTTIPDLVSPMFAQLAGTPAALKCWGPPDRRMGTGFNSPNSDTRVRAGKTFDVVLNTLDRYGNPSTCCPRNYTAALGLGSGALVGVTNRRTRQGDSRFMRLMLTKVEDAAIRFGPLHPQLQHRPLGCYADSHEDPDVGALVPLANNLPQTCMSHCLELGDFRYFALQGGSLCACGNSYGRYGALWTAECSETCSGDPGGERPVICGGKARASSVYEIASGAISAPSINPVLCTTIEVWPGEPYAFEFVDLPPPCYRRVGCFMDTGEWGTAQPPTDKLSAARCYAVCRGKGSRYFGLRGKQCVCSPRAAGGTRAPAADCAAPCGGDAAEGCGAAARAAVYAIAEGPCLEYRACESFALTVRLADQYGNLVPETSDQVAAWFKEYGGGEPSAGEQPALASSHQLHLAAAQGTLPALPPLPPLPPSLPIALGPPPLLPPLPGQQVSPLVAGTAPPGLPASLLSLAPHLTAPPPALQPLQLAPIPVGVSFPPPFNNPFFPPKRPQVRTVKLGVRRGAEDQLKPQGATAEMGTAAAECRLNCGEAALARFSAVSYCAAGSIQLEGKAGSQIQPAVSPVVVIRPGCVDCAPASGCPASDACGAPGSLRVAEQPGTALAGKGMRRIVIEALDASGNVAVDSNASVRLAAKGSWILTGAAVSQLDSGRAAFSGLSVRRAGTLQLQATVVGGTVSADLANITVLQRAAAVQAAPAEVSAGEAFEVTLHVVTDSQPGVTLTSSTASLSLACSWCGSNPPAAQAAVSGAATFSGLSIPAAGTHTLHGFSTDPAISAGPPVTITVLPAAPAGVTITAPQVAVACKDFSVGVDVVDANGNSITHWPGNLTLYAVPCAAEGDDECNAPASASDAAAFVADVARSASRATAPAVLWVGTAASAGVAVVEGLQYRTAHPTVRIAAALAGAPAFGLSLAPAAVVVRHGTPFRSDISVATCASPGGGARVVVAGASFTAIVTARDRCDNVATSIRAFSTVAVAEGGAALTGATSLRTVLGRAEHRGLRVTRAGTVRLTAQVCSLPVARSVAITVTPGPPASVSADCPAGEVTAGAAFGLTGRLLDGGGNRVNGSSLALLRSLQGAQAVASAGCPIPQGGAGALVAAAMLTQGSATLSGTLSGSLATGSLTLAGLSYSKAERVTVRLSAPGLAAVDCTFSVVAGDPSTLQAVTHPSRASVGVAFPRVTFNVLDSAGNLVTAQSVAALLRASGGAAKPLSAAAGGGGALTAASEGGVLTFQGFTYPEAATITLTAAVGGSGPEGTTGSITVAQDAAVVVSPSGASTVTAGAAFSVRVQVQTTGGAVQSSYTGQLQLNLVTVGSGAVLAAWASPAGAEGADYTFTGLTLTAAGAYRVEAAGDAALVAPTDSGVITVVAAAPAAIAVAAALSDAALATAAPPPSALPAAAAAERATLAAATAGSPLAITALLTDANGNLAACSGMTATGRSTAACTITDASCTCTWALAAFVYVTDPGNSGQCLQSSATDAAAAACTTCPAWTGAVTGCKKVYRPFSIGGALHAPAANAPSTAASVTVQRAAGHATFTGVVYTGTGTVYWEVSDAAYSTGWTSAPAAASYSHGPVDSIVVAAAPGAACSDGSPFSALRAELADAWGNLAASAAGTVTVQPGELASGTLGGPRSADAAGGVASFSGLRYDVAEELLLELQAPLLLAGQVYEHRVAVRGCVADHLVVTAQPSVVVSGEPCYFAVAAVDVNNNVVHTAEQSVVLSVTEGTGTFYEGATQLPLTQGRANFTGLRFDAAGVIRVAFAPLPCGMAGAESGPVRIVHGPAAAIAITDVTDPMAWDIAGELTAEVLDSNGNLAASETLLLELTAACQGSGCGINAPTGSLRAAAAEGAVRFAPVVLPSGHAGQSSVTGVVFTVSPPSGSAVRPASSAAVTVQTNSVAIGTYTRNVAAGTALAVPVTIRDAAGTQVGVAVTVTVEALRRVRSEGSGYWESAYSATCSTVQGACTAQLTAAASGPYQLRAAATGYKPAADWLSVTPGPAAACSIEYAPVAVVAGSHFAVDVGLADAQGNSPVCGFERGTRRSGELLQLSAQSSPAACSNACTAAAACMAWFFAPANGSCSLLARPGTALAAPDFASGLRGVPSCTGYDAGTVTLGPPWLAPASTPYAVSPGGAARFDALHYDLVGRLTVNVSCFSTEVTAVVTVIAGAPSLLVITAQPRSVQAGAPFAVRAEVRDYLGNRVPSVTEQVAVSLYRGSGQLGGRTEVAPDRGAAVFSALRYTVAESILLVAHTPSQLRAVSGAIAVRAGPPARVTAHAPPEAVAGVPFSLAVRVRDAYGNPAPPGNGTAVSLQQVSGPTEPRGGAAGTSNLGSLCPTARSCRFSGAAANVTGLVHTASGEVVLNCTVDGLPPVTAGPIAVRHSASGWRLRPLFPAPVRGTAEVPLPALRFEVTDRWNNLVPTGADGGVVTLEAARGGLLDGQTDATIAQGVVVFDPVAWYRDPQCATPLADRPAPPEGLTAAECPATVTGSVLQPLVGLPSVAAAGVALELTVEQLRITVGAAQTADAAVSASVALLDAQGAALLQARSVTLALSDFRPSAAAAGAAANTSIPLQGLTSLTDAGTGVAAFSFDAQSLGGYTISASAPQATTATADFTVAPGAAASFTLTDVPTGPVEAGVGWAVGVAVADRVGHAVSAETNLFRASLATGADGSLAPAAGARDLAVGTGSAAGWYTFTYAVPGAIDVRVDAVGVTGWVSAFQTTGPIEVTCGAPAALYAVSPAPSAQPLATSASSSFGVTLGVQDRLGNVLTQGNAPRSESAECPGAQCTIVAVGVAAGAGFLGGGAEAQVGANQQAAFAALQYRTAETGVVLRFTAPGLSHADVAVTVTAGDPAVLSVRVSDRSPKAGDTFTITITAKDAFGNVPAWTVAAMAAADKIEGALRASAAGAPTAAALSPTAIANGVAAVSLTLTAATRFEASYTGLYSGAALRAALTGEIVVSPGAPSALAVLSSPSSAEAGQPVPPTAVELRDAHGNAVGVPGAECSIVVAADDAQYRAGGSADAGLPYSFRVGAADTVPKVQFSASGQAYFNPFGSTGRYSAPWPVAPVATLTFAAAGTWAAGAPVAQSTSAAAGTVRTAVASGTSVEVLVTSDADFDTASAVTIGGTAAGTPTAASTAAASLSLVAVASIPQSATPPAGCVCRMEWEYPSEPGGGAETLRGCAQTHNTAGLTLATLTGLTAPTTGIWADAANLALEHRVEQQASGAAGTLRLATSGGTATVVVTSAAAFTTGGSVTIANTDWGTPSAVSTAPGGYWCYLSEAGCTGVWTDAASTDPDQRQAAWCTVAPNAPIKTALTALSVESTQTVVTAAPASAAAGSTFTVGFELRSSAGAVLTAVSLTSGVTAKLHIGGCTSGCATFSCTVAAGVGSCPGISTTTAGTAQVEIAVTGAYPDAWSDAFPVIPGAASAVSVISYPDTGVAVSTPFPVVVEVRDLNGNPTWRGADTVRAAVAAGSAANFTGVTARPLKKPGRLAFVALRYTAVGSVTLEFSAELGGSALPAVTKGSCTFAVFAGPPAAVAFRLVPESAAVGSAFTVAVRTEDAHGFYARPGQAVGLSVSAAGLGTLGGTAAALWPTAPAAAGVGEEHVSFQVSYDRVGRLFLSASADAPLWRPDSAAIDILAGPPAAVQFTRVPGSVVSGARFAVTVTLTDAGGNPVSCPAACTPTLSVAGGDQEWTLGQQTAGSGPDFAFSAADVMPFVNEDSPDPQVAELLAVITLSGGGNATGSAEVLVQPAPAPPPPEPPQCSPLTDCSGHGNCGAEGACECYAAPELGFFAGEKCTRCETGYYAYPLCNKRRCPEDEMGKECGGRGLCSDSGTCLCFGSAGAAGALSAEAPAGGGASPRAAYTAAGNGLYGHWCGATCGSCCSGYRCGSCNCPDCSTAGCGGHGTCQSDGSCACSAGYSGGLCSVCAPAPAAGSAGGAVVQADGTCSLTPPRCDCSQAFPAGRGYFGAGHPKPQIDCQGRNGPPPIEPPLDDCGCPLALSYECIPGTQGVTPLCPGSGCPASDCPTDSTGAVVCQQAAPAQVDCKGFCLQFAAPSGTDHCGCPLAPAPVCAAGTGGGSRCLPKPRCVTDIADPNPVYLDCFGAVHIAAQLMTDRSVNSSARMTAASAAPQSARRRISYAYTQRWLQDFDGCSSVRLPTCNPRTVSSPPPKRCDGTCPFWGDLFGATLQDSVGEGIEIDCGGWPAPQLNPNADPCGCPFPKFRCRAGTEGVCGACPQWGAAAEVDCRGGPPPQVVLPAPHPCGCAPPPAPRCRAGTEQTCLCDSRALAVREVAIDCGGLPLPRLTWSPDWAARTDLFASPTDRCLACKTVPQVRCAEGTAPPDVPLSCPSPPCKDCAEPANCPVLAAPQAVDCGGRPAPQRVPYDAWCDCPTPLPNTCICGTDATGREGCASGCQADPSECSPYVCGERRGAALQTGAVCRASCAEEAHCAAGYQCVASRCVSPPPAISGCALQPAQCYPYACDTAAGVCKTSCSTDSDCSTGKQCLAEVVVESDGFDGPDYASVGAPATTSASTTYDASTTSAAAADAAGHCRDPRPPDWCAAHDKCYPYACGASNRQRAFRTSSCRHSCAVDDHCHPEAHCETAAARCRPGRPEKPDSCRGRAWDFCAPYACGDHRALHPLEGARCRADCSDDGHCAVLYRCNSTARVCIPTVLKTIGQQPTEIPESCFNGGDRSLEPVRCLAVPNGPGGDPTAEIVRIPPLAPPAPREGRSGVRCKADPLQCAPYICGPLGGVPAKQLADNAECSRSCSTDEECVAGHVCDRHKCARLRGLGAACSEPHQCASAHCVAGACCNSACEAQCSTCMSMGTCEWVNPKSDPRRDCGKCQWCVVPAGAAYGDSRECAPEDYSFDVHNDCGAHGVCNGDGGCLCDNSPQTGFWGGPSCGRCKAGYGGSACKDPPAPSCTSVGSGGELLLTPDARPIQWAARVLEVASENRPGSADAILGKPDAGTPYRTHRHSDRAWAPVQGYCTDATQGSQRCYDLPSPSNASLQSPPGSCSASATCQYIVLEFNTAVYITGVKIMENFNPGSVVGIWAQPALSGPAAAGLPVGAVLNGSLVYQKAARKDDVLRLPYPRFGWALAGAKGENGPVSVNANGKPFSLLWSREDPAFHSQPRYSEFLASYGAGSADGCSGTVPLTGVTPFRSKVIKIELEPTSPGLSQIDAVGIMGFTKLGLLECPGRVEGAVQAEGCSAASSTAPACRSTAAKEVKYCSGRGACTPDGCHCTGFFSGSGCGDCRFGYSGEFCEIPPPTEQAPVEPPAPTPTGGGDGGDAASCCQDVATTIQNVEQKLKETRADAGTSCRLAAFEDLTQYTVAELGRQWLMRSYVTGEYDECDKNAYPGTDEFYDMIGGPDFQGRFLNITTNGMYDPAYRSPVVPYKHFARKMETPPYNLGKHTHIRISAGLLVSDLPKDPNSGVIVRVAKYQTGRSECGWTPTGSGESLQRSAVELQASEERLVFVKHIPFSTGVNIIGRGKGDSMESLDVTIAWAPENVSVSFQIWSPGIYRADHKFTLTSFALYSCNFQDVSNAEPNPGDQCETDCRARAAANDTAKRGECAVEFRTVAGGALARDGSSPAVWNYGDDKALRTCVNYDLSVQDPALGTGSPARYPPECGRVYFPLNATPGQHACPLLT